MTNAEQFIVHYIAIERVLRRVYGSKGQYETFLQLVSKAEKKHSVISYYANDLREYGELRNAIVHNRTPEENAIIAEPHSYVVERMAIIRANIEKPIKIKDVMTKPVFIRKDTDNIFKTAKKMFDNVYTHVPIYKDDNFMGILSETALLRWAGSYANNNMVLNKEATINEMLNLLDQPGNKFNDYEFAPKNMYVLDSRARFESALSNGRRLGAIFITKTGKKDEKIEGMLTAWDLPRLKLK